MKTAIALAAVALAATPHTAFAQERTITPMGLDGPLAGTLIAVDAPDAPAAVIIPGSGPTDRNGNGPLSLKGASYRLLAEALAVQGVSTLRIDKRGMFGSNAAIPDANKVTIDAYTDDALAWAEDLREATGQSCVWLMGHSEGGIAAADGGGTNSFTRTRPMRRSWRRPMRRSRSWRRANGSIAPTFTRR